MWGRCDMAEDVAKAAGLPAWVGRLVLGVGVLVIGGALMAGFSAYADVGKHEVRLGTVERGMAEAEAQQREVIKLVRETREDAAEFRGTAAAISRQLDAIEKKL